MRKDWIIAQERAANILRHFDDGMGLPEIAAMYGLSYMRVHQIVTKAKGQTLRAMRRTMKVNAH